MMRIHTHTKKQVFHILEYPLLNTIKQLFAMKNALLTLICILGFATVHSQVRSEEVLLRSVDGRPQVLELSKTKVAAEMTEINSFLKAELKVAAGVDFQGIAKPTQISDSLLGSVKLQQFLPWNSCRIWNGKSVNQKW